jgi:RNA polymerase sigma-70 factor (ECF subfamily)
VPGSDQDWGAVLKRVLEGDHLALAQVARLVNGFLAHWHAYDFRDEWDDLVQEVVAAGALALRDGRLREPRAAVGFLRSTARFKYVDRLRLQLRLPEGETREWQLARAPSQDTLAALDVHRALGRVPEKTRRALLAVYVAGHTYEEAAQTTGIPLGTLKRCLRDGLAELRAALRDELESPEPT